MIFSLPVDLLAVCIANSVAWEPVQLKKHLDSPSGAITVRSLASFTTGLLRKDTVMVEISFSCSLIDSFILSSPYPVLIDVAPDIKSRYFFPVVSWSVIPSPFFRRIDRYFV